MTFFWLCPPITLIYSKLHLSNAMYVYIYIFIVMLSILKLSGNAYNVFREHPLFPITESVLLLPDILSDCISHLVIPFLSPVDFKPMKYRNSVFLPIVSSGLDTVSSIIWTHNNYLLIIKWLYYVANTDPQQS